MKKSVLLLFALGFVCSVCAQELKPITLLAPNKTRGKSVMEALSMRASVREWAVKPLSLVDLSDLLWAANGINRPAEGKRTAASAQNAQDIDIYVFTKDGIYLYDAVKSVLKPVVAGDYRDLPGRTEAPVNLVLVTDISKFRGPGGPPPGNPPAGDRPANTQRKGDRPNADDRSAGKRPPAAPSAGATPATPPPGAPPPGNVPMNPASVDSLKLGWGNLDAGIVSQNISLFCAATGLKTRPRSSFPGAQKIMELLHLKPTQFILLNHPVGYARE